jgi:predicted AAA+ superfamily ATPase
MVGNMIEIPRRIIAEYDGKLDHQFTNSNLLQISGPNRSGKSYILSQFLADYSANEILKVDGMNISDRLMLMNNDIETLRRWARGKKMLFIDNAHQIPRAQEAIVTLQELYPQMRIIVTYSTRAIDDIAQIKIYPVSYFAISGMYPSTEPIDLLSELLIYGSLPEVLLAPTIQEKQQVLDHIVHMDMLRDIFDLERITNSKALMDILYYIALNVNKSISINTIAQHADLNPRTARRYLDILENHYIIHEHKPFKRALRNEISLLSRYYFYDIGIRNALISNYSKYNMRSDIDAIWANFLIMERHKHQELKGVSHTSDYESYFWETWTNREIDLIEVDRRDVDEQAIRAFRFKFIDRLRPSNPVPMLFMKTYRDSKCLLVTLENFADFITTL